MPRKGVPYGDGVCSLKERIAELEQRMASLVNTINHIAANSGDISIAADAPLNVTNDATAHKITIALDNSKLPSSAVSSVNGETGAVVLDAEDIPSRGNSNVQADIDAEASARSGAVSDEASARAAADAALQTAVGGKVDKITGGSIKRAYTHTGSVQDDTPLVDGTDADSIGLRNANGRMQATDPAAGATDKTLVTANWVSQSGESKPNNLIHSNGDETKNGMLTLGNGLTLYNAKWEVIPITIFKWASDSTTPPDKHIYIGGGFAIKDVNNRNMWNIRAYRETNGRDMLSIEGYAYDNTNAYFHFEIGPNGYRKITTNFDKPENW